MSPAGGARHGRRIIVPNRGTRIEPTVRPRGYCGCVGGSGDDIEQAVRYLTLPTSLFIGLGSPIYCLVLYEVRVKGIVELGRDEVQDAFFTQQSETLHLREHTLYSDPSTSNLTFNLRPARTQSPTFE